MLTYADGAPFPPDQRDERKGGGLGTSVNRKRNRECDTITNRFPDGLWIVRNPEGRITLAVAIECDEDSHTSNDPSCEAARIDEIFQSVQALAAKEGAVKHTKGRHDAQMVPIVTIKFNPNACDVKFVRLRDRMKEVARLTNWYLHKTEAEVRAMCDKELWRVPIVHILYYHTKEGAKHLAYFGKWAVEAGWFYHVKYAKFSTV